MPDRFPTRPERLAQERIEARREAREEPATLNPDFPYEAIPFPLSDFRARPAWAVDPDESEG